jgi:hypothetical protein
MLPTPFHPLIHPSVSPYMPSPFPSSLSCSPFLSTYPSFQVLPSFQPTLPFKPALPTVELFYSNTPRVSPIVCLWPPSSPPFPRPPSHYSHDALTCSASTSSWRSRAWHTPSKATYCCSAALTACRRGDTSDDVTVPGDAASANCSACA